MKRLAPVALLLVSLPAAASPWDTFTTLFSDSTAALSAQIDALASRVDTAIALLEAIEEGQSATEAPLTFHELSYEVAIEDSSYYWESYYGRVNFTDYAWVSCDTPYRVETIRLHTCPESGSVCAGGGGALTVSSFMVAEADSELFRQYRLDDGQPFEHGQYLPERVVELGSLGVDVFSLFGLGPQAVAADGAFLVRWDAIDVDPTGYAASIRADAIVTAPTNAVCTMGR